jgi:hypothetical protein
MANRYAAKIRGVPAADRAVTIGCRIKPGRPELIGAPRTAVTRPAVYRRSPQADPSSGQGAPEAGRAARYEILTGCATGGVVALCNHAECGISVHFAPLIASCRL